MGKLCLLYIGVWVGSFISCSEPSEPYDLVIRNVNLIDGTGGELQKSVSIGIMNGRILTIDKTAL